MVLLLKKRKKDVIVIQEASVGHPISRGGKAPSLRSYISYAHLVQNGPITYIYSIPHQIFRYFTHDDMTFQLPKLAVGNGMIRICNVYSASARPHIKYHTEASTWTLDNHITEAEKKADGLNFQRQPTLYSLHKHQSSRDDLVALQEYVQIESWHQFTNSLI
ncbi:hypothetical protein SK128_026744 [Halocaridina rubra]|uniref:Uncharacterized protein n=1 Tax=Halocaridina rubra TaxID=373956 RepID=A0AAN8XFQ6_HALRR